MSEKVAIHRGTPTGHGSHSSLLSSRGTAATTDSSFADSVLPEAGSLVRTPEVIVKNYVAGRIFGAR